MIFISTNIDLILADFNKKVTQLTELAEKYQSQAADKSVAAANLQAEADVLVAESGRARNIAVKINKLVS